MWNTFLTKQIMLALIMRTANVADSISLKNLFWFNFWTYKKQYLRRNSPIRSSMFVWVTISAVVGAYIIALLLEGDNTQIHWKLCAVFFPCFSSKQNTESLVSQSSDASDKQNIHCMHLLWITEKKNASSLLCLCYLHIFYLSTQIYMYTAPHRHSRDWRLFCVLSVRRTIHI